MKPKVLLLLSVLILSCVFYHFVKNDSINIAKVSADLHKELDIEKTINSELSAEVQVLQSQQRIVSYAQKNLDLHIMPAQHKYYYNVVQEKTNNNMSIYKMLDYVIPPASALTR